MKHYRAWVAVLAILISVAAAPAFAGGKHGGGSSAVAPLTTESFLASELPEPIGSLAVEGTCNPLGPSTFTFTASGQAAGPYPGTFTETGTLVIDLFTVTSFEASFRIDSPAGTVTGTKSLVLPFTGLCGDAAFPTGGAGALRAEGTVSYAAAIVTPTGSRTDSGTAFVNLGETQLRGVAGVNGFVFQENFTSTAADPCEDDRRVRDDDDDDEDDCDEDDDD